MRAAEKNAREKKSQRVSFAERDAPSGYPILPTQNRFYNFILAEY
jgi:hypothetical protein